jgi:hypothetical protein
MRHTPQGRRANKKYTLSDLERDRQAELRKIIKIGIIITPGFWPIVYGK